MNHNPIEYIAKLCDAQGIKYSVDGSTLRLGSGVITLPVPDVILPRGSTRPGKQKAQWKRERQGKPQ